MLVKGWPRRQREHGRRSWSGLRSRPCGQCWHKHLRGGSPVADRGMRAHGIVVTAPALDDDLGFAQRVEDLAVEQLVAQTRVEAFDEAVLPWAARRDVGGLRAHRAEPAAGCTIHRPAQAGALRLPSGDFQPLASPDSLDPLVIDQPPGPAQQLGNLAVAGAAVLPGQLDDVGGQPGFILTALRDLAMRRAMLAERRTGTALGNRQLSSNMLDAGTATRGAQ